MKTMNPPIILVAANPKTLITFWFVFSMYHPRCPIGNYIVHKYINLKYTYCNAAEFTNKFSILKFFSILQVAKTNTAQDVISQALNKSRKDSVGECRIPENYVLVS